MSTPSPALPGSVKWAVTAFPGAQAGARLGKPVEKSSARNVRIGNRGGGDLLSGERGLVFEAGGDDPGRPCIRRQMLSDRKFDAGQQVVELGETNDGRALLDGFAGLREDLDHVAAALSDDVPYIGSCRGSERDSSTWIRDRAPASRVFSAASLAAASCTARSETFLLSAFSVRARS